MARIVELAQGNPFLALELAHAASLRGQRLLGDVQHPPDDLLAQRMQKSGRAVGALARSRRRSW
jgi:hypothetical protein